MLVVIQQGGRVLSVEDNDVDRVADVSFRVEDNCLFDRVAVGEVLAQKINKVLLIYFAAVASVSDAVRRLQFRDEAFLLGGERFAKKLCALRDAVFRSIRLDSLVSCMFFLFHMITFIVASPCRLRIVAAIKKTGIIPVVSLYTLSYRKVKRKINMAKEFKDRLRRAREARGMSQADLANKTGLQPAAVSHFETGQRSPSFENLKKLADALSLSVDYLLGRINEEQHGHGLAAAPRAQQLFRHAEKLSDDSFSQLEEMAEMLRKREERKKGGSG